MVARPLGNVRVLDVSHVIAGPFCTMLLANAGAEIIKIEPPRLGEHTRNSGHSILGDADEAATLQFVRVNRGKRSVGLNLQHAAGKEIFKKLAAVSDVLIENFRPGTMQRLGLDYEVMKAVNPRLIFTSISGYGKRDDLKGPYSDWPANNPSAQAMSGLMDVTGEPGAPPSLVGASIGDTIPGLWAAYGIMLALAHREKSGEGQHLDIAMYDSLVMHNDVAIPFYDVFGKVAGRNREDMWSTQLRLEASDGYVVISGKAPPQKWAELWRVAGRDDLAADPKYLAEKVDGPFLVQTVRPVLEEWTRTQKKSELCSFLLGLGFSAAMVQTAREVYECPQLEARDMFHEFDFLGRHFRFPGDPVKLSEVPPSPGMPPPRLGEHNQQVLGDLLGLTTTEIDVLRAEGVI